MRVEYLNTKYDRAFANMVNVELNEKVVQLNKQELKIIQDALIVVAKAGQLQTDLNAINGWDDWSNNPYSWAEIYLNEVVSK